MDAFNLPAPQAAPPVARLQRIQHWRWNDLREKVAYRYFCWRYVHKMLWPTQYAQCLLPCPTAASATLAEEQDVQGGGSFCLC